VNDKNEQDQLRLQVPDPEPNPGPATGQYPDDVIDNQDFVMEEDPDFDENDDDDGDLGDGDEEIEEENPYLRNSGSGVDIIDPEISFGSLRRVVHTNGIHHIAMVSCQCHGDDDLPLDLFAEQLLPASLKRIRTLFTAQVLDMFRLSNLELKASAYQFYQMLRRLTRPMASSEVVNLYREFRRMTRIWRWMKRLKWAGYPGSTKKVKDVGAGELAIFCPACPQPGINIPENWREDSARHVTIESYFGRY